MFFFIPIVILLFFAYLPSILIPYITHDDMNFWLEGNVRFLGEYYLSVGRFGSYAMMHLFDNMFDYSIVEFTFNIRSLLIFINAISCFIFFHILRRNFSSLEALLLSVCIFTLPGIGGTINWVVVSGGIFAMPFSLLAYIILIDCKSLGKKTRIYLSIISLQLSLFTYVAAAPMFVIPSILKILFSKEDRKTTIKEVILVIQIFLISISAYFLITKFLLTPFLKSKGIYIEPFNPSHNFSIDINLQDKILFFYEEIFTISNLWNIYPSKIWSIATFLIIASGLYYCCHENYIKLSSLKKDKLLLLKGVAPILFLLAITTVTYMAPANPMSIYRIYLPSMAGYFFIIYWSIKLIWRNSFFKESFKDYHQYLAIIFIVPALFFAQFNSITTARNSDLEYNYIKAKIGEHLESHSSLKNIHFIQIPPKNLSYIGYPLRGGKDGAEFNSNAVYEVFYGIVNMIFSEAKEDRVTKKAHRELIPNGKMFGISYDEKDLKEAHSIKVTWSESKPTNLTNDDTTLIINMNNLGEKNRAIFKEFLLKKRAN